MKMTKKKAEQYLYELWEQGEVPANFTEDHTHYDEALKIVMLKGYFDYNEDLF
jgi:hypothetical protein